MEKSDWRSEKRKTGGSIKTINGRIYARIQYMDEMTGKRKEKLRPAPNRTRARELVREMRRELSGGQESLESDKLTFRQVADRYEKVKLVPPVFRNGLKVSGKRSYRAQRYLLTALKNHFGSRLIRSIKPGDIEAYKAKRLATPVITEKNVREPNPVKQRKKILVRKVSIERPRAIASVNRELSLLRQIFVFAETEELVLRNPFARAAKVISAAAETHRDRVLGRDEETLLLDACSTEARRHIRPLVIVALDTAMRKGELLTLQWKDVDLRLNMITVRATNTKTERSRMIGMTERVRGEIGRLWDISPKDRDGLVFGIRSEFRRAWSAAVAQIGAVDLHFHDLRHTAITRMIRAGVAASEAMKISGHTEMKTFQRYVNLTHESVTVSAGLLDRFNSDAAAHLDTEAVN
jgi:integrase